MYRTILVPLDGSELSERALPLATVLAKTLQAKLILVRAASAATFPGVDPTAAQCRAVEESQAYLYAFATQLSEQGLSVEAAVPFGDAADSILLEIDLHSAELVVMCTQGRSGLGRWIYGSVAESVLARSPAPVLLVQSSGEIPTLGPDPAQASILVPLDGSALAEMALPHASGFAKAFGGDLWLLNVIEPYTAPYTYPGVGMVRMPYEEEHQRAEAYLDGVANGLRDDGLTVHTAVRDGWPAETVASAGRELGASLIAMATHGRTGVLKLLLGSIALGTVRRTSLPVLLVRPAAPSERDATPGDEGR